MIKKIINHIKIKKNIDINGYEDKFVREQIEDRIIQIHAKSYSDYFNRIKTDAFELDKLTERLSNNTSRFFRKPLLFEYLYSVLLPELISAKGKEDDYSLRIWSAGCSQGQEPYSVAILLNELPNGLENFNVNIFSSDVNNENLRKANSALYNFESIKNVKYGLLKKYFIQREEEFELATSVKEMVQFSKFDLLDLKHQSPPESIFGNFDIILCCNVLMYYKAGYKEIIFNKLYKNLTPGGYLILGESEELPEKYRDIFLKTFNQENIYKKLNLI